MPQALALITNAAPEERRGFALGLFGGVTALAAIVGPVVGGYIITAWSWHWIFDINVPIGLVSLAATILLLPGARSGVRRSIDPVGMLLVGGGLLGVVFGLLEGERYHWGVIRGPVAIPEVIGAGIVLLGLFVSWELRYRGGLLPTSLLRRRNYAIGNVIAALMALSMLGLLFSVVLFCQVVLGLSALSTGYALMPAFLGLLLASPLGGRLAERVGGKYPLLTGMVVGGLGFGLVIHAAAVSASPRDLIIPLAVIGMGQGLSMAPLFSMVMAGIPEDAVGAASGFVSAARSLGQALGTAVIGGVLQNHLAMAMHDQAVIFSAQLPPALQGRFVTALSSAVRGWCAPARLGCS